MAGRDDPQLITLKGPTGHELFGLVEGPIGPGVKTMVMCHSGLMGRHGDHRMHIRLHKRLIEAGYAVTRFDPHGIGISEGELPEMAQRDIFAVIEKGELADDVVAWMEMLTERFGADRFAINGACGAAMTAMLAAEKHKKVEDVVGVSVPVMLDGTDPVVINEHFLRAYKTLNEQNQRLLMVYATTDHFWTNYCELFQKPHAELIDQCKETVELMTMDRGNHLFSLREWQIEIDDKIMSWLRQ